MTEYEKVPIFSALIFMAIGFMAGLIFGFENQTISLPFIAATVSCYAMYLHLFDRHGLPKHKSPPSSVEMFVFTLGTAMFVGPISLLPYVIGAFIHENLI